jgi:hypothetical protein
VWFALERLHAGLSQLHARRRQHTRTVGLLKHDISGARACESQPLLITTATRRVLVRTRVCNTLCAQWGVIDGNLHIIAPQLVTQEHCAANGVNDTSTCGIATQEHSLFLAVRHCISRLRRGSSSTARGAIVLVVVCWICGSFTYSRSGYGTRVSLSPHSAPKQACSSRRATRPARRTSPPPPRSRTPGPRSLTMTLEMTTPATRTHLRGRRLPHAVADRRRPLLKCCAAPQQPWLSAVRT